MNVRLASLLLLAGLAAGPGLAQGARPDSLAMTCAQVQRLVRQAGGIVVGTGPNLFDRYVSDRRFCEPTQGLRRSFVETRDARSCFVGYRCYEPGASDSFGFDD
jgi:hypothetical protein